jgi:hypothetical protein
MENNPKIFILYICQQENFQHFEDITFVYFPQNATGFIILSFYVQTIFMLFINHALIFNTHPGKINVNVLISRKLYITTLQSVVQKCQVPHQGGN